MAATRLGNQNISPKGNNDNDEDMKPLIREYGKTHPEIYDEMHLVTHGRVSKNDSWCMINTANYVLLIKASASSMQELFNEILPQVSGKKANALVVEPVKKDRYGGCLAVEDSVQMYYDFDEKELSFEIVEELNKNAGKKQKTLSIGMFLDTSASSTSTPETKTKTSSDKPLTEVSTKTKPIKS